RLAPDAPGALATLGRALGELGHHAEAIAACRRAIAVRPDWSEAHWNLALPLLRTGQYEEGWREFEWRFTAARRRLRPEPSALPAWQGEPLAGRTLLVYWEQGFGDTIHFCRYVPLLAAAGARVLLQVQAPLRRLLAGLAGVAEFVGEDASAVRADFKVALMSLPHRFGTTLETIPATMPYLVAPALPAGLTLGHSGRRRVGLAWGGSPAQTNNRFRSIPLADLAPLCALPGIDWYSLQVGATAAEAATLAAAGVTDLGPRLGDFADTAAVMQELDLVLTIDTSVAHLAGALGRPTWILLSHTCCWRYLLDRTDSPWYPTARLFRQPARGAWAPVVAAVRTALEESRP
ncbi:MAG TPA: glycosyltransferase family 9 protein, partial [Gemmatimonadales bacterium]|nr:glycosyltransferase family 9 protein [Gemmatimonadales bacterium]